MELFKHDLHGLKLLYVQVELHTAEALILSQVFDLKIAMLRTQSQCHKLYHYH